jgi:hypothetical protein
MIQDPTERPMNAGDKPSQASWRRAPGNTGIPKMQQNRGVLQIPAQSPKKDRLDNFNALRLNSSAVYPINSARMRAATSLPRSPVSPVGPTHDGHPASQAQSASRPAVWRSNSGGLLAAAERERPALDSAVPRTSSQPSITAALGCHCRPSANYTFRTGALSTNPLQSNTRRSRSISEVQDDHSTRPAKILLKQFPDH